MLSKANVRRGDIMKHMIVVSALTALLFFVGGQSHAEREKERKKIEKK
jgi:hypothetical protein